jgi:hypothetical protein
VRLPLESPLGVLKLELQLQYKEKLTMVTKMPSNVINVEKHIRPATASAFRVVDVKTGEVLFKEKDTRWHNYEKADQLERRGMSVEVEYWSPFTGKYGLVSAAAPVGLDEDWRAVMAARRAKQGKAKVNGAAAVDETLISKLGNISVVTKNSASLLRKSQLSNKDMFDVSEMLHALAEELSQRIDYDDPAVKEVTQ